jgi:D-glycero-D-manno-heptose 1,7-bisphosphate phosphatase
MGVGKSLKYPAIFLDRDGVVNRAIVRERKPYPPDSLSEVEILPGVLEAISSLKKAGFLIVVVTNQPDVARGKRSREEVETINRHLESALGIDHFRTCYHDDSDNCHCRKPKPGLLMDASALLGIDLDSSFLVGDRWRDIGAGRAAGCKTVWIDYGYDEKVPDGFDFRALSLLDASCWILEQKK